MSVLLASQSVKVLVEHVALSFVAVLGELACGWGKVYGNSLQAL